MEHHCLVNKSRKPDVYSILKHCGDCWILLWKQPTRCNYTGWFIIPSQLCMFRAIFSPLIRSTWLYLQHLVVFTQVAAGLCLKWVSTHSWHQRAATWVNTTRCC